MKKEQGFTIGEFLITLAVIGVVSVMAIPNFMKFQQDKDIVTGVEEVRGILAQATKMAETNTAALETWNLEDMTSEDVFNEYYKPYLQIGINCTGKSSADCWEETSSFKGDSKAEGGAKYGIVGTSAPVSFVLSNNMNMTLTKVKNIEERFGVDTTLDNAVIFMADINGTRGPNKLGYDVFSFVLTENGIMPAGSDNDSGNCKKGSDLADDYWDCSARVLEDERRNYI